jgi:gliding motility-associated-like protein
MIRKIHFYTHAFISPKSLMFSLIFGLFLFFNPSFAQLKVTGSLSLQQVQSLLFGPDVTVTNFSIGCPTGAYGSFDGTGSNIGLNSGILLTTGSLNQAVGPNNAADAGKDNKAPGDACLQNYITGGGGCVVGGACNQPGCTGTSTNGGVCKCTACGGGGTSFDACGIEFDVTPTCNTIKINYVFASEEYPEYVGQNVSDAFAFFISGPGITGPACNNSKNIALVPGTTIPISIDNVNAGKNGSYYFDNKNGSSVEYDGFTKILTASTQVTACQTYHIKIVIADFGDGIYDSGVFLQKGGINCGTPSLTVTGKDAIECCKNGSFTFTLDQAPATPLTIYYTTSGTATKGTDYSGLQDSVVIPAGQTTVTIPVTAVCDGIAEGAETIKLSVGQAMCAGVLTASATIKISDPPIANAGADVTICPANGGANLSASGGGTYSWSPTTGLSCTACPNPVATPAVTTTYIVTVTDSSGCTSKDTINVNVSCGPLVIVDGGSICANTCMNLTATASGGTAPYAYAWTPNIGTGAGPYNVCPGITTTIYTVTITDKNGNTATDTAIVNVNPALVLTTSIIPTKCGGADGSATANPSGGTSPYTFNWNPGAGPTINNLAAGSYTITITDSKGCTITAVANVPSSGGASVTASGTDVSCFGYNNGSATATGSGGTAPYTFSWSPAPASGSLATVSNLTAGTYTVTITDAIGCLTTSSVTINQPPAIVLTISKVDANCGGADGSVTVTPTAGAGAPYTFTWTPISGTDATLSNIPQGTYTVVITDKNGCTKDTTIVVSDIGSPAITTTKTDILCNGDASGSITTNVSGGILPYTFNWSPNGSTAPNSSALTAGTYAVTVTGANGCKVSANVTITEPSVITLTTTKTDANCGASDGEACVTATGGTPPYTYAWTPSGAAASCASKIKSGGYTVTVTDRNGCTKTVVETVNDIGAPSVTAISTNVTCNGGANGTATATATLGVIPYTYSWNPGGSTSPNPTGLKAGTYVLTVIASNGCKASASVTITEPPAILLSIAKTDEICSDAKGTAVVSASGGTPAYTYLWSNGQALNSLANLSAGAYSVIVTDANNCSKTIQTSISNILNYGPTAKFIMDPSVTEILAPTIRFFDQTTNPISRLWDLGDGSKDSSQNPIHTYKDTGTYTVCLEIINQFGCSSRICSQLIINPVWSFYIPNAFSPDGDGKNETFNGLGQGISDYELYIFDRWGDLIFKSVSLNVPWDGRVNGGSKIAQQDVYVYKVVLKDIFGKKHRYIGSVTLLH